jgi:hypothetical protein
MAKQYPVQTKVELQQLTANAVGEIRVDRILSRANRRLYREGRNYSVKIDLDSSTVTVGASVNVYVLKDTWFTHKAWQKAFEEHLNATALERDRAGQTRLARWNDFRVNSGVTAAEMYGLQFTEALGPVSQTNGEFILSSITDSSGTDRTFTWSGSPTASQFGIMVEYGKQGGPNTLPTSPSSDMPYSEMDSDASNAEFDDVTDHGNFPPYATNLEDGTPFTQVATLTSDPGTQKMSSGFFNAPCGIVIVTGLDATVLQRLTLTAKGGDYKGVHAPRMFNQIKEHNNQVKVV